MHEGFFESSKGEEKLIPIMKQVEFKKSKALRISRCTFFATHSKYWLLYLLALSRITHRGICLAMKLSSSFRNVTLFNIYELLYWIVSCMGEWAL